MKVAPLPPNETKRLEALYSYDILDTTAEKEYDEITQLASQICQTPIALITLIDKDRQWFKSKVGIGISETSRDYAFCSHAILQNEPMQVCNALQDERFYDNPYVAGEPFVRFYTGIPLTTSEGYNLGTLCVVDTKPRQLNEHQLFALKVLAKQVAEKIEMRLKNKQLNFQKQILEKQLEFQKKVFALIAHDVRSPLISAHGLMSLIVENGMSFKEVEQSIHKIQQEIRNSLDVLDNILAWGKLQENNGGINPSIKVCETKKLLDPIIHFYKTKAERKNIELAFEVSQIPATIYTDPFLLGSIIRNLLSNAIKFTHKGGKIKCEIYQEYNNLKIKVQDNGIGMPEEVQRSFWTGENIHSRPGTDNEKGSGSALQLLRTFIYLLGGKIFLESKENEGTTFTVTLPLNAG